MSEFNIGTHSYIGFASCGCARALAHDVPGMEKDTAREVAGYIKSGLVVERFLNEEAANRFHRQADCEKHKPKPKPVQEMLNA